MSEIEENNLQSLPPQPPSLPPHGENPTVEEQGTFELISLFLLDNSQQT